MNKIIEFINQQKEDIRLYLYDLDLKKDLIAYKVDTQIISASTIKVLIMLKALKEVELGKWHLNDLYEITQSDIIEDTIEEGSYSLETLIEKMITESHNITTNIIIKALGFDVINQYAKDLGLTKTSLNRYMLDFEAVSKGINNYTSQKDLCLLFEALYHDLLQEKMKEFAFKTLLAQKDHRFVERYFDKPLPYAHKTGDLDYLHHDAGILSLKGKHYYLGVSIYNTLDKEGNFDLAGKLGKMIIEEIEDEF